MADEQMQQAARAAQGYAEAVRATARFVEGLDGLPGPDAVAEYASADASFPAGPETLVVPISASEADDVHEATDAMVHELGEIRRAAGLPGVTTVDTAMGPAPAADPA